MVFTDSAAARTTGGRAGDGSESSSVATSRTPGRLKTAASRGVPVIFVAAKSLAMAGGQPVTAFLRLLAANPFFASFHAGPVGRKRNKVPRRRLLCCSSIPRRRLLCCSSIDLVPVKQGGRRQGQNLGLQPLPAPHTRIRKVNVRDVSGKVSGVVKTCFLLAKSPLFVREVVKTIFFLSIKNAGEHNYKESEIASFR